MKQFFEKNNCDTPNRYTPQMFKLLLSSILGISGRIYLYLFVPFLSITFNIYSICVPYLLNTPQSRSNGTFKRKPFLKISSRYPPIDFGFQAQSRELFVYSKHLPAPAFLFITHLHLLLSFVFMILIIYHFKKLAFRLASLRAGIKIESLICF